MFYSAVFKALNKAKVKYVVAGGTAVILHGYRRFTDDLDLMVLLEERNLGKMFDSLKAIGYSPKVPVMKEQFVDPRERKKWKKEKGMIVFSFVERNPPFKIIDMFVDEPIRFEDVYKNRVQAKIEGIIVPIMSIEHLKKLKRIAGRDIDLIDIVQLDALRNKRIR